MLFPLLLAGHLLGDWVVQTDWQAANKAWSWRDRRPSEDSVPAYIANLLARAKEFASYRETQLAKGPECPNEIEPSPPAETPRQRWWYSIRANQAHCLTYHLAMAAFVLPAWHTWGTVLAFVVSWASHGFIDRRWPVRWLLRNTGSPAFAEQLWGVIAADQALHIVILALIAAAAS